MAQLTNDDVVAVLAALGISDQQTLAGALGVALNLYQAGVSQQFVARLQLLNKRTVLEQQRTERQNAQQQAVANASQPFNTEIDAINAQLSQVEQELSQLQVS